MQQEAIKKAAEFIRALPPEITWVEVESGESSTKTIGRDYILDQLEKAIKGAKE